MQTNLNEETWELFYNKYLQNDPDFNYLLKQELATGRIEKDSDCKYLSIEDTLLLGIGDFMFKFYNTDYFSNLWKRAQPWQLVTFINQRLFTFAAIQKFIDNFNTKLTYNYSILNKYSYYAEMSSSLFNLLSLRCKVAELNWKKFWISIKSGTDIATSFDKINVVCSLYDGNSKNTEVAVYTETINLGQLSQTVQKYIKIMEKAGL